jgi:hypothetical protein
MFLRLGEYELALEDAEYYIKKFPRHSIGHELKVLAMVGSTSTHDAF